jgi:hypothetical protein
MAPPGMCRIENPLTQIQESHAENPRADVQFLGSSHISMGLPKGTATSNIDLF